MRGDNVMEVPFFLLVLELTFTIVSEAVHPGLSMPKGLLTAVSIKSPNMDTDLDT
ncbi:hypothetical protein TcasGA2_TC031332 [Tribolium castaneum]|uniref:Uncharacterized protein n=1 Tax=Tribolium castaneum TaxID=7070 RepID=A0A139WB41_TRICA|nr:hypothetical protein TcasGA2_TC031332 [Tribolium castaneum]